MDNDEFLEELEVMIDEYVLEDNSKLSEEAKKFKYAILKIISKIPIHSIMSVRGYHDVNKFYLPDEDDFHTSD